MSIIKQVLNQDAFWMLNKNIAQKVGLESALLLSELIGRESYMTNKLEIDGEEYFHATCDSLENATSLSYKIQRKCIKHLKNAEFIKTKLRGIPAKQHFTLCHNQIEQFIRTSSAQKEELLYKNNTIKSNYKKNITQTNLLGEAVRGLHDFKNSQYYNVETFKNKFSEAILAGVDVEYYWHSLNDYSLGKGKKYKDWAAAGRSFMRSDKNKGNLKMVGGSSGDVDLAFFNIGN